MTPITFLGFAIGIILALTIHEFAHAWTADKLGDPTARVKGRLTLNPLAHIDPLGALCFIFMKFGWGKPVPYDPRNFKHPIRDAVFTALAGPVSNLLLAFLLFIPYQYLPFTRELLILPIFVNIAVAVFNLLPIPPLDGSKLLLIIFSHKRLAPYFKYTQYLSIILVAVIGFELVFNIPILSRVVTPVVEGIFFMLQQTT